MQLTTQQENSNRVDLLYRKYNSKLLKYCHRLQMKYNRLDNANADDIMQELYIYLLEKCNPALWYEDTFNLRWCHLYIRSRAIDKIKAKNGKPAEYIEGANYDAIDLDYVDSLIEADTIQADKIDKAYSEVMNELEAIKKEKKWSSAMLFELHTVKEMSYKEIKKQTKIANSTIYTNNKYIKDRLKQTIKNPFNDDTSIQ